ncbi:hypothetical protein ACFQGR_04620 [Weissella sagaensis]|uniref:Uncharacterized protein n=1 Tax=Weissella sagaensis TaxID=2559928 RepID=A0ABW1RU10_9LACO|nr:hypothetical protein [Weissella sagaensis]
MQRALKNLLSLLPKIYMSFVTLLVTLFGAPGLMTFFVKKFEFNKTGTILITNFIILVISTIIYALSVILVNLICIKKLTVRVKIKNKQGNSIKKQIFLAENNEPTKIRMDFTYDYGRFFSFLLRLIGAQGVLYFYPESVRCQVTNKKDYMEFNNVPIDQSVISIPLCNHKYEKEPIELVDIDVVLRVIETGYSSLLLKFKIEGGDSILCKLICKIINYHNFFVRVDLNSFQLERGNK